MYTARSPGTTDAARQSSHSPQTPQPSPPWGMAWTMRPSRSLALCWSQYAQSRRRATQKRHMSAMVGLLASGTLGYSRVLSGSLYSRVLSARVCDGRPTLRIRIPQGGETVSCSVFRAPRGDKGGEDSGDSGMQRNTVEYVSSRPLECWVGEKNTCSASRSRTVACGAPARCRARLESRQVQGEPWAAHCPHPAALPALRAALPTLQTLSAVPAALSAALPAAHSRPALSALLNCPHRRAPPGTPPASGNLG